MLQIIHSLDNAESYDADVLSVFGTSALSRLHTWLSKNPQRFVLCIEKDLKAFLQVKQEVQHPRIKLYQWDLNACHRISWEFCLLRLTLVAVNEEEKRFSTRLKEVYTQVHLLISDFRDLGESIVSNVLQNITHLPTSLLGESLQNCCQNIPAIICGAGPSLDRQIPLLIQAQKRALVFGAGSAMCALETQKVQPHFGAALDADPPFSRFLAQTGYETPYFYQSRISSKQLLALHGRKLWVPDPGNYPLEQWIYQELGLLCQPLDSGWTSANFSAAIAAHLGCNPIICVGMDFCCPSHQVYAAGMQPDEGHWVECVNTKQEKRVSKPDWLASAYWLDQFANNNAQLEWIYTDQEAVPLESLTYMPLEQVLSRLPSDLDTTSFSYALTAQAFESKVTQADVRATLQGVSNSFIEARNLCDQLLELWQKYHPASPLEIAEFAVLESDLAQNICAQKFLQPLWEIWKWPILRQEESVLARALHRHVFFKKVVEVHLSTFKSLKIC